MHRARLLLALCLLISPAPVALAETPQSFGARLSMLAAEAKFEEALALAEDFRKSVEPINGGKSALLAEALSWKAFLLSANGNVLKAGEYFESAADLYREILPADHPDLATSLNNLGYHRYRMGQYKESLALYRQALDIRERVLGPNDSVIADTLNNMAELFKAMERLDEVAPLLNRALEIRVRNFTPDDPRIAAAMQNLAGALELDPKGDKFVAAQKLLENALAIRLKSQKPEHPDVTGVKSKLATNLFNQNKYLEAEPKFIEALAARRKSQPAKHPDIAGTLAGLGLNEYELGKYSDAEAAIREALQIREKSLAPNSVAIAETYRWLARVLDRQGRNEEALDMMRRGSRIVLARGDRRLLSAELLHDHLALLATAGAQAGVKAGDVIEEAFLTGQNADFSETGAALSNMAARFATRDKVLQDLVHERDEIEARLVALERQLTDDLSRAPANRRPDTRFKMAELDLRRTAIDDILKKDFPTYFDLIKPDALSVEAARALLKPDEALISLVSTPSKTFVWVLTRERAAWHGAAVTSGWLETSVATLRGALDTEDLKKNISLQGSLFNVGLAHELYAKLLQPVEGVFKDKTHLIIVPSGPLTSLPFQVLVTQQPKIIRPTLGELSSYHDVDWLIRRHALSTLPSVKSLKSLRQLEKSVQARKPLIGFGNPKLPKRISSNSTVATPARLAQAETRGTGGSANDVFDTVGVFSSLDELPETEQELKTVATELGAPESDLHFGIAATEAIVKQTDLSPYQVVYFATHGLLADDLKALGEPALVLTPPVNATALDDGLLTASEISDTLKLNADWVVLAACNTASGAKAGGESLSGLAKAFFHAGARALLVSHWRVDSEAAAKLTTSTFAFQNKDKSMGRAEALRKAMLAQIEKSPTQPSELWNAYPAFWAPFTIVGEGAL